MRSYTLLVQAGDRERRNCPVTVELEANGIESVLLDDAPLPYFDAAGVNGKTVLRFVLEHLAAGATARLVAREGAATAAPALTVTDDEQSVTVWRGPAQVSTYHHADPAAARPYWHPVHDPYGGVITRGYPMHDIEGEKQDHPHHRSLWVAFGEVNGTDNWSEGANHCKQTHEGWNTLAGGGACAVLDQNLAWRDREGAPVLLERRVWRLWNVPTSESIWDLEIDLTPAPGVAQVEFGDTKEGGLCSVRVATSMDVPAGRIENAIGGINEPETWGKRAAWCDYSGPVRGNLVGLTIMDHPTSFRHPTWWHVRNYGLMTANCFGLSHYTNNAERGDYTLPAGETMKFRYRIFVHPGDATQGQVATRYHDFAHPPRVIVE